MSAETPWIWHQQTRHPVKKATRLAVELILLAALVVYIIQFPWVFLGAVGILVASGVLTLLVGLITWIVSEDDPE